MVFMPFLITPGALLLASVILIVAWLSKDIQYKGGGGGGGGLILLIHIQTSSV